MKYFVMIGRIHRLQPFDPSTSCLMRVNLAKMRLVSEAVSHENSPRRMSVQGKTPPMM